MKTRALFAFVTCALFTLGVLFGLSSVNAATVGGDAPHSQAFHPVTPPAATPTPPKKFILPFNRNYKAIITNGPGEGAHTGNSFEAIDFSPRGWTQVQAAKTGTVYIRQNFTTWGNLVVLQHADGYYSYYAHLVALPSNWAVGDQILKGQAIGTVGNTGTYANGIHAHLEVRDLMSGSNPATGSSVNHSIRRLLGIGFFPWYADSAMNSGYVTISTSHPVGKCLGNNRITVQWPTLNEYAHTLNGVNQVDGFSYGFSTDPEYIPDKDMDLEENISSLTSNPISPMTTQPVNWYFHPRVKQLDGAATAPWASPKEVSHAGPYKLASTCPTSATESDWNTIDEEDNP